VGSGRKKQNGGNYGKAKTVAEGPRGGSWGGVRTFMLKIPEKKGGQPLVLTLSRRGNCSRKDVQGKVEGYGGVLTRKKSSISQGHIAARSSVEWNNGWEDSHRRKI